MDIYTQVDECNSRLAIQSTPALMKEVIAYSGMDRALATALFNQPAVLFRQLITAPNETARFFEIASRLKRDPLLLTYTEDLFTPSQNPYKKRLGKIRVESGNGGYRNINIINFQDSINKPLQGIKCKNGTSLVKFHMSLASRLMGVTPTFEMSYFLSGKSRTFYERVLALFTCAGILVESYVRQGHEHMFTDEIVFPAFEATMRRFGCPPIITPLLPVDTELDPFWDSFPKAAFAPALVASGKGGLSQDEFA